MIHLTGGDLARVYAAGLMQSSGVDPAMARDDGRKAINDFMAALTEIDGQMPHVGDAYLLGAPQPWPTGG